MARITRTPPKPAFFSRSITLTADVEEALRDFSQDAQDVMGRAIGSSAILRALVRHAGRQGEQWFRAQIFPLIEQELDAGVVWGKKR